MTAENQTEFRSWAKVEVMGHQIHIGFVTTEVYGAAVLFRVDQPAVGEQSEYTLPRPKYLGNQYCPAGTVVRRGAIEAATVLLGAGSVYRITPCTEEAAMKAIAENFRPPLMLVRLAERPAIAAVDDEESWAVNDSEEDDPAGHL